MNRDGNTNILYLRAINLSVAIGMFGTGTDNFRHRNHVISLWSDTRRENSNDNRFAFDHVRNKAHWRSTGGHIIRYYACIGGDLVPPVTRFVQGQLLLRLPATKSREAGDVTSALKWKLRGKEIRTKANRRPSRGSKERYGGNTGKTWSKTGFCPGISDFLCLPSINTQHSSYGEISFINCY